ncbi:hypothetical protein BT69DRAFT_1222908, partial [Atractiella rhizophila]
RMLDWFHETKEFYQLKEVEKLCSKAKGITMPTIKEILQSLVDDGLVFSEKIGTSNYFWSYPSAAAISVKNALEASRKEVVDVGKSREAVRKELSEMLKVKEDGVRRRRTIELGKSKNLEERRLKA